MLSSRSEALDTGGVLLWISGTAGCSIPRSPTAARLHLRLLGEERLCAREHGLDRDKAYVTDLDDEVETTCAAYPAAVVTEIAILRNELAAAERR